MRAPEGPVDADALDKDDRDARYGKGVTELTQDALLAKPHAFTIRIKCVEHHRDDCPIESCQAEVRTRAQAAAAARPAPLAQQQAAFRAARGVATPKPGDRT